MASQGCGLVQTRARTIRAPFCVVIPIKHVKQQIRKIAVRSLVMSGRRPALFDGVQTRTDEECGVRHTPNPECISSHLRPHHTKLVLTTFWKMLPKPAQTVCERSEGSSNCLRSV